MNVIVTIFWGLLLLCLVVFIHEAGHFFVARWEGVRVTEFFLGMPCRWNLSRRSRRYGTRYGVTPILLGGYNQICGMQGAAPEGSAEVLAALMRRGRASAQELAEDTGLEPDRVLDCLVLLSDWASVEPFYDPERGERPSQSTYPARFQTVDRDGRLLTRYDRGHDFELPGSTLAGEPHELAIPSDEFLRMERSHTYQGRGFWGRFAMLVAGVCVNIVFGIAIIVIAVMTYGISVSNLDLAQVGEVEPNSLAQSIGLREGDDVLSIDGTAVADWQELTTALHSAMESGADFDIVVSRDGVEESLTVPGGHVGTTLGIMAPTERLRLGFGDALAYCFNYLGLVAQMIGNLLSPAHVGEVISQSTSIVGITVMAGQAASQGIIPYVLIAASVSISLGFVNILPIPPLDGGKIVIEAVQALIRRPLPEKAVLAFNYVGIGLFLLLFFVLLQQDLFRFVIS